MIEQKSRKKEEHRIEKTKRTLLLLLATAAIIAMPDLQAQNNTNSPFSIFGIGEIEMRDFGRTAGMGNVGIGIQSENFLNRRNPAGLSGIDTLRFILDVSAAVKFSEFSTTLYDRRTTNFNIKNIAVGVRLTKGWTSSVGLGSYSNVGYSLREQQYIQGTDEYMNINFRGNGGINKFYWANAYELFRGFSAGITASYLFGNTTHFEETEILSIKTTHNVSEFKLDFGAQYSYWFEDHTRITVGGTYVNKSDIAVQRSLNISSVTAIERNQRLPDLKSYVPEKYGAGLSILRNKRDAEWIFAVDYQFQNWSIDPLRHKSLTYTDSHIYSAGLQLTPNKRRPEKYLHAMRFNLGASINKTYLKVNGFQMDDYSISMGVGFPFRNSSFVNIAVNAGESGTGERGGITEKYVLLSVNISMIERWFAKPQWD